MRFSELIDIAFFIFVTGGISTLFGNLGMNSFSSLSNYILVVFYIIMIFRLFINKLKMNKIGSICVYIFSTFIVMNMFVSQDTSASIKAFFYLICNILYAYHLYSRYSPKKFIKLISYALGIIAISNLLLCIILPSKFTYFDTAYITTVWKGIFPHKNTLGNISAFTILIMYLNIKFDSNKKNKLASIMILIICLINLHYAESHTPLYALIICIIYIIIKKFIKKEISLIYYIVILIINYLYIIKFDFIYKMLYQYNIDLSISGRREIFDILLNLISKRPILGYGLGSVWLENSFTYNQVYNYVGFNPNTSHNAFIELGINIGLVGLIIYLVMLTITFVKSISKNNIIEGSNDLIVIMIFLLVMSIFESTLAVHVNIYWVIQFYIFFNSSSRKY